MTEHLHHLAAAYALDALDVDERRAFEAHYPTCDVCAAEVEAFRETAAVLATSEVAEPPPALRHAVMSEIARTRQLPPLLPDVVVDLAERRRAGSSRPVFLAAAAAALVAVVGTLFAVRLTDATDPVAEVLAADDVELVTLEGGGESIIVAWSPERDEVAVLGDGLEPLGSDQVYELWILEDGAAVPAGLFQPDDDGLHLVLAVEDRMADAFAVTVEPTGGSPQPTGDIILSGDV